MSPGERPESVDTEARTSGNGAPASAEESVRELLALLQARFAVLSASVRALIAVHTDRAQLAIRRRIQSLILGVLAGVAGVALAVYSVVHVVRGTAQGLAELFEGRQWLGSLAAGLLFLLLMGGSVVLALRRWDRKELAKQREKYASIQRDQDEGITRSEALREPL